jgi:hypothetical protein
MSAPTVRATAVDAPDLDRRVADPVNVRGQRTSDRPRGSGAGQRPCAWPLRHAGRSGQWPRPSWSGTTTSHPRSTELSTHAGGSPEPASDTDGRRSRDALRGVGDRGGLGVVPGRTPLGADERPRTRTDRSEPGRSPPEPLRSSPPCRAGTGTTSGCSTGRRTGSPRARNGPRSRPAARSGRAHRRPSGDPVRPGRTRRRDPRR